MSELEIPEVDLPILNYEIGGNTLFAWTIALGIAIGVYLILSLLNRMVRNRAEKLSSNLHANLSHHINTVLASTKQISLFMVALYLGSRALTLREGWQTFAYRAFILVVFLQIGLWLARLTKSILSKRFEERAESDPSSATAFGLITFLGQTVVWSITLLIILDNFGVDITALVAGLGVGGIAVALAVQNVLGDVLASLSIILDKPFQVGDFIVVDDMLGTVERIGVKTTRVKSLSGEQLIFSNSDLLGSRIRNYKRLFERRVVFSIGVIYQTSREQLEQIPQLIQEIIETEENARFDRSHFKEFGGSSLNFETVYYVLGPDFTLYMDIQQRINLALFTKFEELGIEFAYPTQTLFVENSAGVEASPSGS